MTPRIRPSLAAVPLLAAMLQMVLLADGASAQPASGQGFCLVIAGAVAEDAEPCERQVETYVNDEGREVHRYIHIWPSGSRTIIEQDAEVTTINGVQTRAVGGTLGISCFQNSETERFFCFFYLPGEEE